MASEYFKPIFDQIRALDDPSYNKGTELLEKNIRALIKEGLLPPALEQLYRPPSDRSHVFVEELARWPSGKKNTAVFNRLTGADYFEVRRDIPSEQILKIRNVGRAWANAIITALRDTPDSFTPEEKTPRQVLSEKLSKFIAENGGHSIPDHVHTKLTAATLRFWGFNRPYPPETSALFSKLGLELNIPEAKLLGKALDACRAESMPTFGSLRSIKSARFAELDRVGPHTLTFLQAAFGNS